MPSMIEWTDETWNPVTGCDRCSPGCDNCYALELAGRLKAMGQPKYQNDGDPASSGPGFGVTCHEAELGRPKRWRKPRMVFVNSMSDLFHPEVDQSFQLDVFDVMAATPQHTYQVLTKRPQAMAKFPTEWGYSRTDVMAGVPDSPEWPLPNVWLGTSIETNRYTFRAGHLRDTPAAVRFLSLEPLLGPLPDLDLTGIDWVIVGGESGRDARPMHPAWVRSIRDRCQEAGVPFFFKQWGEFVPPDQIDSAGMDDVLLNERGACVDLDGHVYWHQGAYPCGASNVGVWRLGKKAAGRMLDGRTWDEMPEVVQ